MADAFFIPDQDRFISTGWTRGPWDSGQQHAGPPAALVARAIERVDTDPSWRISRFTFEILKAIPIAPLRVTARIARPGRRVRFAEATLFAEDTEIARAGAWQIRTSEAPMPDVGTEPGDLPGPEASPALPTYDPGTDESYFRAMEWRFARGAFFEPGPAAAWMRMRIPLVEGEEPSPLSRVLVAADSGNGISSIANLSETLFINVELTAHLLRYPAGEWVCLDATTRVDAGGIGLTESILWDEKGLIGRSHQSLLVAPR